MRSKPPLQTLSMKAPAAPFSSSVSSRIAGAMKTAAPWYSNSFAS